jgi:hypothetical protein
MPPTGACPWMLDVTGSQGDVDDLELDRLDGVASPAATIRAREMNLYRHYFDLVADRRCRHDVPHRKRMMAVTKPGLPRDRDQ